MALYHLKMSHGIFYRLNLLFRTSGLFTIGRLGLVIVLPLDDPMLLLDLRNIKIRHINPILLLHPLLDFLICCLGFCAGQIQLVHIHLDLDMMLRF